MENVPIFPLPLVFLPGIQLPLQIFELRYRRMVKECLANNSGFIIAYAQHYSRGFAKDSQSQGGEADGFAACATYGEIIDWQPMPNQMIGILVQGQLKVRVKECGTEPDGLITGTAEIIENDLFGADSDNVPDSIFMRLKRHPLVSCLPLKLEKNNAQNISYQLTYLLPFSAPQKQKLLELESTTERLEQIVSQLKES